MMRYRRRAVEVETFQYEVDAPPPWFEAALAEGVCVPQPGLLAIAIGGYWAFCQEGDWVVRDPGGNIWSVEQDSFSLLYEEIEDAGTHTGQDDAPV